MNTIEKKFNTLIDKAKKEALLLTLLSTEKEEIKSHIVAFMKDNQMPIAKSNTIDTRHYLATRLSFLKNLDFAVGKTKKPFFKYVFAVSVFAIFLGTGVVFSAQSALPGDVLYPVKVGVNERVLSFISFSDESKAKYDVRLVQLRLEEIEKVASGKKIDTQTSTKITSLLDQHLKDVKAHTANTKSENKSKVSVEIHSDLEASLNAHTQILNNLAGKESDGDPKNIQSILLDVQSKTVQIGQQRQNSEDALSLQSVTYLKNSADAKLKEAERNLKEVSHFISDKKGKVNSNFYNDAKTNLTIARDAISQGQEKLQSGDYSQAFSLFQKAVRITQETHINFSALIKLNITLPGILNYR